MSSSFFVNTGGSAAERETISNDLTASANAKADAQKLAINPEDSQFTLSDNTTIGNSALHHAAKAEASATSAAGSASTATQQAGVATQAKLDAQSATADALTYRNEAVDANNNAVLVTGAQTIAGAKTFSNAMIVNDTVTADGLTMLDSKKITLGTGGDLEIYHNGSNSVIEEKGNGHLFIKGTDLVLEDTSGNKFFKGVAGGAVQIWHNASSHSIAKLATTATGIDVTGEVKGDSLNIDGDAVFTSSNTNDQVTIENTSTSTFSAPDLKFKRTGAVGQTSNIGVIGFDALNSTPVNFAYANIVADATNITAGSETGTIKLQVHDPADGLNYPVPKLSVDKDGIDVTGTVNADGLTLGDSEYIKIGAGNNAGIPDLQIFSGGGNAFIEQPSGSGNNNNLIIRGQNINLRNDADATLISTDNDQVRMWTQVAGSEDSSNSAAKFSTTTTGIDVNGTVTADGLNVVTPDGTSATIDVGADYLTVECDDLESGLLVKNNTTDAGSTPDLLLRRTGNTSTGQENLGIILFQGLNDASPTRQNTTFANIIGRQVSPTNGDEDGAVLHRVIKDGTMTSILEVQKDGIDVTGTVTSDKLKVDTTTDVKALQIISSHTGSGATPDVSIERSAIPSGTTDGYHSIGNFNFVGMNATENGGTYSTGSSSIEYARMAVIANEHLTGSETGRVSFGVYDHAKAGGAGLVGSLDIYPHKVSTGVNLDVTGTVTASGNVLLGTTVSSSFTDSGYRFNVGDAGYAEFVRTTTTDNSANVYVVRKSDGRVFSFRKNNEVGKIEIDETSTSYTTSSDYRLKTDVQPMTGATDRLKQLNPVNFQWIADGTRVDGFLAHEAQAVVPEAVTGAKDAVDDEGNPDYQGIDQSKLVPLLVATIKELEARITALEA